MKHKRNSIQRNMVLALYRQWKHDVNENGNTIATDYLYSQFIMLRKMLYQDYARLEFEQSKIDEVTQLIRTPEITRTPEFKQKLSELIEIVGITHPSVIGINNRIFLYWRKN